MSQKSKVEITAVSVRQAISESQPASMTQLAHHLGYSGSVSSSVTRKFRQLVPDIDSLLAANKLAGNGEAKADATGKAKAAKPVKRTGGKAKLPLRHPQNPFRAGSYGTAFDILASHPAGLPREKLITLLAKATGKDIQHAAFDCQVVCSARQNDMGLNPFEGPRNRACRNGFYVERQNSHVRLVLPAAPAAKETP
ncbi:MAG: hypothetical protein ACOYOU_17660 [Kiritimatiellia bacterium]